MPTSRLIKRLKTKNSSWILWENGSDQSLISNCINSTPRWYFTVREIKHRLFFKAISSYFIVEHVWKTQNMSWDCVSTQEKTRRSWKTQNLRLWKCRKSKRRSTTFLDLFYCSNLFWVSFLPFCMVCSEQRTKTPFTIWTGQSFRMGLTRFWCFSCILCWSIPWFPFPWLCQSRSSRCARVTLLWKTTLCTVSSERNGLRSRVPHWMRSLAKSSTSSATKQVH